MRATGLDNKRQGPGHWPWTLPLVYASETGLGASTELAPREADQERVPPAHVVGPTVWAGVQSPDQHADRHGEVGNPSPRSGPPWSFSDLLFQ